MGVSSVKRSRVGASTHLHQAIGFVTAADLRFGQADILHNIIVTPKSSTELSLAFAVEIVKRERDLRVCVSNPIER
jgi:hypothetical protein